MKRVRFLILIIGLLLVLMIIGCSQKKVGNPDITDDTSGENDNSGNVIFRYFCSPSETYDLSRNVYEGELLEYDKEALLGRDEKIKIKVKVTRTFKGYKLPGEIVEDYLFIYGINTTLEKNTKYLFMTQDGNIKIKTRYEFSEYHVVPLENKDGVVLLSSYMRELGYDKAVNYYSELVYEMLRLDQVDYDYGFYYGGNTNGLDIVHDYTNATMEGYKSDHMDLGQFFVLADNVFIGEEIEYKKIGRRKIIVECYDDWDELEVYMVKVRVLDVVKGDYKPGDIIIDVLGGAYGEGTHVYFTGDSFFEGYDELLTTVRESQNKETEETAENTQPAA